MNAPQKCNSRNKECELIVREVLKIEPIITEEIYEVIDKLNTTEILQQIARF